MFGSEFDRFYRDCLAELKARENYTDAWLPQLDRFVTLTAKLAELNTSLVDEEIVVEHTNKAKAKNQATSPKWRMFIYLNKEANQLAKDLGLSPTSAPKTSLKKKEKTGFDLGMRVAK